MSGFFEWVTGRHTYEYGVVSRTGRYTCQCGAVYRVTTTKTPVADTDIVTCENCNRIIDSWGQSTSFRSYYLISRPG
jgi:predicted SprT family Zn-dependent metalloprotease